mmetsp:Transcript_31524/g.79136  ORF Transcript_31524/g.79136 Transcript_31524/m.79136 type:complete len:237 (-) Transcript_31524:2114-2824(-)
MSIVAAAVNVSTLDPASAADKARLHVDASSTRKRSGSSVLAPRRRHEVTSKSAAPAVAPAGSAEGFRTEPRSSSSEKRRVSRGGGGIVSLPPLPMPPPLIGCVALSWRPTSSETPLEAALSNETPLALSSISRTSTRRYAGSRGATPARGDAPTELPPPALPPPLLRSDAGEGCSAPTKGSSSPGATSATPSTPLRTHTLRPRKLTSPPAPSLRVPSDEERATDWLDSDDRRIDAA